MKKRKTGTRYTIWVPLEVLEAYRAMARARSVSVSSLIIATAERSFKRKRRNK